jgi:hypothetical protein
MTTQSTAKPRAKRQTRSESRAQTQESKSPNTFTVKQKPQEVVTSVYRIQKGGGIVYMIQQRGVSVYDKNNNSVRSIRYCPQEPSIYVDEQSDNAVKEAVIFRDGSIIVPKEKPNLFAYLEAHPDNISNGGSVFYRVDEKRNADDILEKEFSISEAVDKVRDLSIQELLPIALYFGVNINRDTSEIRYNLLQIAKKNPKEFIDSFDSPIVMARAAMHQAKDFQIINVKSNGVYWFDSNGLIVSVPVGQDGIDIASRFCLTEKGASFYEDIKERLSRLS